MVHRDSRGALLSFMRRDQPERMHVKLRPQEFSTQRFLSFKRTVTEPVLEVLDNQYKIRTDAAQPIVVRWSKDGSEEKHTVHVHTYSATSWLSQLRYSMGFCSCHFQQTVDRLFMVVLTIENGYFPVMLMLIRTSKMPLTKSEESLKQTAHGSPWKPMEACQPSSTPNITVCDCAFWST